MGRIIDISTENISDLKTLFETLKDVLNDTTITFFKSKEDLKKNSSSTSKKIKKNVKKSSNKKSKHKLSSGSDDESGSGSGGESDSGSESNTGSDDESDKESDDESNTGSDDESNTGSDDESNNGSDDESDKESDDESDKKSEDESCDVSGTQEECYTESGDDSDGPSKRSNKSTKAKKNVKSKKTKNLKDVKSEKTKDSDMKKSNVYNSNEVADNFSGIKIFNIDENQTLLIFVKLYAASFIKFNCKRDEYQIGVELAPLFKQFKIMDKEGVLSLYVEDTDSLYLNMDVNNPENQCVTNHQIKLLDLNSKAWSLPPSKFQIIVTMKCCDFHKICRDMHSVNCDLIEITCTDKKITFSCMGDSTKVNKTYDNGGGVKIKCPEKKKDNIVIVRNIYEVKYLVMFNKCSSICSDIQIYLKDDYPMFLKYQIATLGDMLVGLSPITDKSVGKTKNYNPAMDVHYPKSEIRMKGDL